MSIYRIDAEFNDRGPVLAADDAPEFPSRLQIATGDSFAELRLNRDDYEAVLNALSNAADEGEPAEADIEDGSFSIGAAPPSTDDTWGVEVVQSDLHYKFTLTESEAESADTLLRTVHPDYDPDPDEDPNVEVEA